VQVPVEEPLVVADVEVGLRPVPGSTLRYGSSFCIVTRSPRAVRSWPRLEAVRPLPREEATPPVTNR
jgi:hypothetical protein